MSFRFVAKCLVVIGLLLSGQFANAQAPQTASQQMSQFPNGGPDLASLVQSLMNADRTNLAAIIAFAKTATEDQRKAIAQGLAEVAKAYAASDPGYVNQIQQEVAGAGLPEFAKAYAEAAGDTGTASTGGGGGGGGPTAGGPPTGGSNGGEGPVGTTATGTQTFSLTGVGGLGGVSPISAQ